MSCTGRTSASVQQRVFAALSAFHKQGILAPKVIVLAKRAGMNRRTVYRALDDLAAAGRIRRVERIEVCDGSAGD
mgnify:CR=1 FL=1